MVWISASLACHKGEWNKLLKEALIPFLTDNQLTDRCIIQFDHSNGENIKCSLLTEELDNLAERAVAYFETWFLQANLNGQVVVVPAESNLPALFSVGFSQIMIAALTNEIIDDDILLTFAFYLQLVLLKAISGIDPKFTDSLKINFSWDETGTAEAVPMAGKEQLAVHFEEEEKQFLSNETVIKEGLLVDQLLVHQKFEGMKESLLEITNDVMHTPGLENLPTWMGQWFNICKTELDRRDENSSIVETYHEITAIIYLHLGLSSTTQAMLSYFIRRVLGLMNIPDVVIAGVQKCGTSTLHFSLIAHSNINSPLQPENNRPIKEVNFICHRTRFYKGLDYYLSHFVGSKGLFLDSSPNYLTAPFCFNRMQVILPTAKLIICIRNPVSRAYSQYNHYKQVLPLSAHWDWNQDKDFLTNVQTELSGIKAKLADNPLHLDSRTVYPGIILRGVYFNQIKQLLNYYDRSQIYISVTDWWPKNYESELVNIQKFLGLEVEMLAPKIANKREYEEPINEEAKQLLTDFYRPYNQKLFEFLGYEIPEWC